MRMKSTRLSVRSHVTDERSTSPTVRSIFKSCKTSRSVQLSVDLTLSVPSPSPCEANFLTAAAAGKIMMNQRSGVILSVTATPGGIGYPYTAGFAPACAAIESFSRNLAGELGTYGVRVVNIRSGGSPDSRVFQEAIEHHPKEMETVLRGMENDTMLKKLPPMEDIANTAVFLASDLAKSITGVTIDVTAGTTAGLNYRVGPTAIRGKEPRPL